MKDDRLYLDHIIGCIERIESYAMAGRDEFLSSTMIQDAIIRNFEVIGEATKRLSGDLRGAHPEIPWRQLAGFRDVLIHQYMGVDVIEVWNVVEHDIANLRRALMAAKATLD